MRLWTIVPEQTKDNAIMPPTSVWMGYYEMIGGVCLFVRPSVCRMP